MLTMLTMVIINFATFCYILLQSKSRETPQSSPESRVDDRVISPMAQALFPMRSAVTGMIDQLAASQAEARLFG